MPIIDGALAYDCPYTHETYILIVRNALHVNAMDHNLIPPFIMREGGVIVNDIPKMHCTDPTIDDHCISFKDIDLEYPSNLMEYSHMFTHVNHYLMNYMEKIRYSLHLMQVTGVLIAHHMLKMNKL